MNDFTASNGLRVVPTPGPLTLELFSEEGVNMLAEMPWLGSDDVVALREFFQAEADERLGRWRWPENPDYVVYPVGDDVVDVLREASVSEITRGPGRQESITRADATAWELDYAQNFYRAAGAYFDAHPEPKPWHDAAAGEVWLLTVDREADVPAVASSSEGGHVVFTAATGGAGGTEEIPPTTVYITAGRRIYPEVSS